MRTVLRSKVTLLFMSLGLLLAFAGVALADVLQDSVTAGSNKKMIATGTANEFTNNYWVQEAGNGSDIGPGNCDIPAGGSATFKLNVPAGVTATSDDGTTADGSPKLVFNACGTSTTNTKSVKFSSDTPGVYSITASFVSGTGGVDDTTDGGFNENPASLELTVFGATTVSPANGAQNVALNTDVTATFSADTATAVTSSNFTLVKDGDATNTSIPASVTYNSTTKTAKLDPTANLDAGQKYNAKLTGIKSKDDSTVTMSDFTWSFTTVAPACTTPAAPVFETDSTEANGNNGWFTGTAPTVSASSTSAGATITYATEVNGGTKSGYSATAPTLGQGTTKVYAKATNGTCTSETIDTFKVDTVNPGVGTASAVTGDAPNFTGATAYLANTWTNKDVKVSWSCTDATSGAVNANGSQTVTAEGATGSVTPTCADNAGNTANGTAFSPIKIDKTNPTISSKAERLKTDGTVDGLYSAGTWTNQSVRVSFSCNDPLSGVDATASDIAGSTLTGSGADQVVNSSGSCFDQAGNSASGASFANIDIDKIAPSISDLGPTTDPNAAGWYNTNVTNRFKASDSLSGLNAACVTAFPAVGTDNIQSKTTSSEGTAVKVTSDSCTDVAGNPKTGVDSANFKIDLTDPAVSVDGFTDGAVYTKGATLPTVSCTVSDSLSGEVNASPTPSVDDDRVNGVGSVTYTCQGADNADNTNSASKTLHVIFDFSGFFSPVDGGTTYNVVKAGQAIPMKFSLGGNQGLNIFYVATANDTYKGSYPVSAKVPCSASSPQDMIEETVTAGNSSLSYDSLSNQYNYVWKTDKAYAGTCRQFQMKLADGTMHTALFNFTR